MSTPNLKINRNKDGVAVTPGQVWKDLDVRMRGRLVRVQEVKEGFAHCVRCDASGAPVGDRVSVLSVRRMHKHVTGWELVSQPTSPEVVQAVARPDSVKELRAFDDSALSDCGAS